MTVTTFALSEDGKYFCDVYTQKECACIPLSHKRPMVVVCPGGGYSMTSDREGEPIALAFAAAGFQTAVIYYPVDEASAWPRPVVALSNAIRMIRERADEFQTDPEKIAVCGFSAGGHLTASLGVHWNAPEICAAAACPNGENRPNALILGYAVITSGEYTHAGSIDHLLQETINPEEREALRDYISCEKHVGPHTPPAFIFHTAEDQGVPVQNALLFAAALSENKIPFELHVYEKGPHGLALADHRTYAGGEIVHYEAENWISQCTRWLWNCFREGIPGLL